MKKLFYILPLFIFILSGCLRVPDAIKDVRELRQDHVFYLNDPSGKKELIAPEIQARMDEDYNIVYFSVWHQSSPFHALPNRVSLDIKNITLNPGFGENKRKHTKAWVKKLGKKAALATYPNALYRGITIRNTNLRNLPTQSPHFNSPGGDSSGWPFDNFQRSSVPANTPVFVCHLSADKAWALVETSFTFGWIPMDDLAAVNDVFVQAWESGRYAVIIKDQTSILDEGNHFILEASIGHIFPVVKETPGGLELLTAVADVNRQAVIRHGFVSTEMSAIKPLRFNSVNAARIANELTGEPYGWGGLYGHRDCSSMTRDFFAPFGIWLPRHSEDQVKEVGTFIDLSGMTPEQKEKTIIEKGVPYLSLLWRKGHVMLYIGEYQGQALIFHNVWGIRTVDLRGQEGRKIIGQAVITTLRPGAELINIDRANGTLLNNINAMNILTLPGKPREKNKNEQIQNGSGI